MKPARTLPLLAILLVLAGCSGSLSEVVDKALPNREAKYETSKSAPKLEVPPGLSGAAINDSMDIPGAGSTTYSQYERGTRKKVASADKVLPQFPNMHVERSGDQRWLVVDAPPDKVWPKVRDFWLQAGFVIAKSDPAIGIMETNWAENRADMPHTLLRTLLDKISPALYSASTRDKFRIRLERGQKPGTTEIYVTHRGAEEVSHGDTYVWQPRPSDPGLEAEMLDRMMVYFGMQEKKARRMLAAGGQEQDRARVVHDPAGGTMLALQEDFSRAWRRTGLALDRVGFTVEDRDRSRGLYYVRYIDPDQAAQKDEGWLSKLMFWKSNKKPGNKDAYLISLIGHGETSTDIVVLNTHGKRDKSATADRILALLHEQLK